MQLQDEILQTICIGASQYLVSDSSWADFVDINSRPRTHTKASLSSLDVFEGFTFLPAPGLFYSLIPPLASSSLTTSSCTLRNRAFLMRCPGNAGAVEAVPDGAIVNIVEGIYSIPRPLVLTGRITLRAVDGHGLAPLFASDVSPVAKRRPYALSDTTKPSLSELQTEIEPSRSFAWSGGAQSATTSFGLGSADSLDGDHIQDSGSVIAVAETSPLGIDEPRRGMEGKCPTECASEWERSGKGVVLRARESFLHFCELAVTHLSGSSYTFKIFIVETDEGVASFE